MRKHIHKTILLIPILIWILVIVYLQVGQMIVDSKIKDADGLTWQSNSIVLKAEVAKLKDGEMKEYLLQVFDREIVIYRKTIFIDWDMGGGGFIGAMQADQDPEIEIVVYQKHRPSDNFYIDFENNQIKEKPFNNAIIESQKTAKKWLKYYAPHPFYFMLWIFITVTYYGLYFFVRLIMWLFFARGKKDLSPEHYTRKKTND